jgi:hypothetical protein
MRARTAIDHQPGKQRENGVKRTSERRRKGVRSREEKRGQEPKATDKGREKRGQEPFFELVPTPRVGMPSPTLRVDPPAEHPPKPPHSSTDPA